MKTDLSFIYDIFQANINIIEDQLTKFDQNKDEASWRFFIGAKEALEKTREDIKNFIKEANKVVKK